MSEESKNNEKNKVKSSGTFEKISGFFDKIEDFMEEKADEFQKGEMGEKIETFTEKTGNQASELLKKVKEAGLRIGDQVDETIDAIKMKKDRTKNQDGAGI